VTSIDVVAAGAREHVPSNGGAEPGSVLAQLRARAAAQRETKRLDLPVGGAFGDLLQLRYRPLPVDELERYAELTGRITNVALAIEMMVSCCETALWVEHGQTADLGVRLTSDLWELLDWPLPVGIESAADLAPRELVNALFGGNGMALGAHLERLSSWMTDPEGTEPGEASAATT
jgi:hypothetical protein